MRALLLLLALAPFARCAELDTGSVDELHARWTERADIAAGRELIARARTPGVGQAEAVKALRPLPTGGDYEALAPLVDEINEIAHATRDGSLGQEVEHWRTFETPAARAAKRSLEWALWREKLYMNLTALAMPGTAVVGALWILFSRSALILLLLGASTALSRAFGDAGAVVEREHRAVLLWPAAAAVTAAVLGVTVWKAMSLVTPRTTFSDAPLLAWRAVVSVRVLVAYFSAGFAFYYMHAMFLTMMIAVARGRRPDFGEAWSAAARRWRDILFLSAATFGGILLVEAAVQSGKRAERGLPRAEAYALDNLLDLAAWLVESGFTMASVVTLAIALGDDVDLFEAARRAGRLLTARARPAMLSMLGIEAASGDAIGGVVMCCFWVGMAGMPLFFALFPDGFAGRLGYPLGMNDAHFVIFGGMALGMLAGSFMYSALLALESIFAAGMYSYASDDAVKGPLYDLLHKAVPQADGILSRVRARAQR